MTKLKEFLCLTLTWILFQFYLKVVSRLITCLLIFYYKIKLMIASDSIENSQKVAKKKIWLITDCTCLIHFFYCLWLILIYWLKKKSALIIIKKIHKTYLLIIITTTTSEATPHKRCSYFLQKNTLYGNIKRP